MFNVYNKWNFVPVQGSGLHITDADGKTYLDFYGGHGVISIGHNHPYWVKRIEDQLARLSFYSNAVPIPLQEEVASKLTAISGYDYELFLCNSGAEANENALKLASFATGKERIISYQGAFHGRTSGAVAVTDNAKIRSPFNEGHAVTVLPLNDPEGTEQALQQGDVAAVIIEGIQGVAGAYVPELDFLRDLRNMCTANSALLILDEVQSGFGRSGKFFAHQHAGITPDLITMAKGMGNGFPVGGVLISPEISSQKGLLGTTFGGNHLACASTLAVLDTLAQEDLLRNAAEVGAAITASAKALPGVREVRGKGLMVGIEFEHEAKQVQLTLIEHGVIAGGAANKNTLRFLPPLTITAQQATAGMDILKEVLTKDHEHLYVPS